MFRAAIIYLIVRGIIGFFIEMRENSDKKIEKGLDRLDDSAIIILIIWFFFG